LNPYLALLRDNRNFRLLWYGQVVSQLGDWFTSVAVYALLLELTGNATSVALMIVVQFLPQAIIGPLAGVVVDRFDRRRVMIAADLLRGAVILVLPFAARAGHVPLIYAVVGTAVAITAFFEPARTAVIPRVTGTANLLTANALSSATWSAMLAIGAGLGGALTALLGRDVAFLLNAASFFVSALFIARARFDASPPKSPRARGLAASTGLTDLVEGARYVRSDRHVAALMLVKAGWGMSGGVILLLTVIGERVFPIGGSGVAGIGLLFAARGLGAGLGPILARAWLGAQQDQMRRAIVPSYLLVALFFLALGWSPGIGTASVAVVCSFAAGSVLWVFSTVLLQMTVPDRFRGRVFATELALVMVVSALSSLVTGWALDSLHLSPFGLIRIIGVLFVLPALGWMVGERQALGARR
jgi:MFS family permease